MQAVILAAGRGARMKELTDDLPKSLLLVNGRPIIKYTLENLPEAISEIILIVGYKADLIKNHLGDSYNGKPISYVEQKELNGTAGALWAAKDLVKDKFLVIYGDDFYNKKDLENLVANELGLLAIETKTPQNFGVIELDEQGNLIRIVERPKEPKSNLVNTGAYVLDKRIFEYSMEPISETEFGLPQTIVKMAADWSMKVEIAQSWRGHNTREDLEKEK